MHLGNVPFGDSCCFPLAPLRHCGVRFSNVQHQDTSMSCSHATWLQSYGNMSPGGTSRPSKQRKIGSRSCDACKIRKVKCTETAPCQRCLTAGLDCTFNKTQSTRGPRNLRTKTLQQIQNATRAQQPASAPSHIPEPSSSSSTADPSNISVESLVVRLCIYRLRLFPVWPIVAVEQVIAALHRDSHDVGTYTLAVAIGAATMAQLKLSRLKDPNIMDSLSASALHEECQRKRRTLNAASASLNRLQTSFFLHIYHENQIPGGAESLLHLREAITVAQIMGLHRPSSYLGLPPSEDRLRRRILWLLFVTERGVAMLHRLPVALTSAEKFPPLDTINEPDDGPHVLPAFKKLVNLFWIFDQSRAFDILQDAADDTDSSSSPNHEALRALQQRLQEARLETEKDANDIQKADISITRQWMQILIWRATQGHAYWSSDDTSASLAGPIQIAQQLLDDISKLPKTALEAHGPGIEFKVYEIASAVADSLNYYTTPRPSDIVFRQPGDILLRLQRFLATCRGGNINLLGLLAARIAQGQMSLSIPRQSFDPAPPSVVVEEIATDADSDEPLPSSPWLSLVAAAELEQEQSLSSYAQQVGLLDNHDWLLAPESPNI
ncbi:uncharacterized protein PODANS_4_1830 [Podospora anserina S mat+]|uniref:Fungal specific transcription factor n=1 Tax=Podospora anserina (strain S / ATCC MYA-4624 / DSM 980 / FGSC 10383) TaxID=515849 RepID=B2ADR4_PODAN|nr:uncharacterized protein PODANS_4_1830 [Podospora anserina S mat+]CAP61579.1 unnamed protein product [Podospora anserina S mat+]CDP27932.1 Putative Fungal specific transcription factor [Podospora anserina S mat+]